MKPRYKIFICPYHHIIELHVYSDGEYKCFSLIDARVEVNDEETELVLSITDNIKNGMLAIAKFNNKDAFIVFSTRVQSYSEAVMAELSYGCEDYNLNYCAIIDNPDIVMEALLKLNTPKNE